MGVRLALSVAYSFARLVEMYNNSSDYIEREIILAPYSADKSYDLSAEYTEADGLFGEKVIEQEKDSILKEAFQDLDDFMFGW